MQGFRIARNAPAWWNLCKTVLQTVVFWTLFLFLLPSLIASAEDSWGWPGFRMPSQEFVAAIGFCAAGALGLWSGVTMALRGRGTPLPLDTARCLVVSGPYRFVRNPMAIAGLGQGFFVGVWFGSPAIFLYVLSGALIWNRWVRPIEEEDMRRRFGEAYLRYRREVRCWLPSRRFRPQA